MRGNAQIGWMCLRSGVDTLEISAGQVLSCRFWLEPARVSDRVDGVQGIGHVDKYDIAAPALYSLKCRLQIAPQDLPRRAFDLRCDWLPGIQRDTGQLQMSESVTLD